MLISTPAIPPAKGWHIRVCIEIEDDILKMFDPGDVHDKRENINDIDRATSVKGGGDILIISLKGKTG